MNTDKKKGQGTGNTFDFSEVGLITNSFSYCYHSTHKEKKLNNGTMNYKFEATGAWIPPLVFSYRHYQTHGNMIKGWTEESQ